MFTPFHRKPTTRNQSSLMRVSGRSACSPRNCQSALTSTSFSLTHFHNPSSASFLLQGVDALAGVEAVISHMIVEKFRIPCAHAPALQPLSLQQVSPRSAAEEVSSSGLSPFSSRGLKSYSPPEGFSKISGLTCGLDPLLSSLHERRQVAFQATFISRLQEACSLQK